MDVPQAIQDRAGIHLSRNQEMDRLVVDLAER